MIATVDSFIRIFKFYQDNPLTQYYYSKDGTFTGAYDRENGKKVIDPKTGKYKRIKLDDIFKLNTLKYEDTVDVYLNSLVLDKYTQLSYDTDSDTVETALDAREKMKKYFSTVLYPGSYAFNTEDNASFRKMLLDWTSTIKTIQDSNKRLTDAYSLNSEDVDKALRGFGLSFVNRGSLISINRRKNFLLNACDLYSIKGTPKSITKALNIIGLNNIFIREGWLFKDNDDKDLKISWQAVRDRQTLNETSNQYEDLNIREEMVTDWDWFQKKINDNSNSDPHWMYSKEDIQKINDDPETYLRLPSITPYFGIEFITDADKQVDSYENVYYELNKQFQKFLFNKEKPSDYKLWLNEYDNKLSILQAYTGLIYCLIRLDDHILYENFRSYLKSCEIQNIPEFTGKYEFYQLIYWFYNTYNVIPKEETGEIDPRFNLIYDYIPIKSNDYCSYEQVLRWWLEQDYQDTDKKYLNGKIFITPEKTDDSPGFIQLSWNAPFAFGRYGVEVYSLSRVEKDENDNIINDGWLEIQNNNWSYEDRMTIIVPTDDADGLGSNIKNFRIVYYHTPDNLPSIYFEPPFNLNNQPQDTFLDRTLRYNGPTLSTSYYDDNDIKVAFKRHHITQDSTNYDIISGYHRNETTSTGIRVADIQDTLTSIYSSAFKYPNLTRLYEDKWMNINNDFYNYVDWSIKDFTDTKKHEGLLTNNRNIDSNGVNSVYRKYPVNAKWNWAIDSNYLYYCYEASKWCRIPVNRFISVTDLQNEYKESNEGSELSVAFNNYGDRLVVGNKMYVYVAINKLAEVDCETAWDVNDYDILPNESLVKTDGTIMWKPGRIKENSRLSRDLAVALLSDTTVLDWIRDDCTLPDNDPKRPEVKRLLEAEIIEVYKDPYNKVNGQSYNYDTFLKYLYNSRLILDFATGYIYPNYQALKDGTHVFFKCYSDTDARLWVTIKPEYEWSDTTKDGVEATTIYSDWKVTSNELGDVSYNKDDSVNLGYLIPSYTLQNRYDSLRFLDGVCYNSYEELETENNKDMIDKSINYVLVREAVKDPTTGKTLRYEPVVYKRVIKMNSIFTDYVSVWQKCTDNRIYDCYYGIAPELIEFIEGRYAQDEQYYINLINDFTDLINNYMTDELGIDDAILDLTIANYSTSGIVKKTINFYKPKRVRLLFTSNNIEGDYGVGNNLDSLFVGDQDFNYYDLAQYRYGNPEFNKKNLNRFNRAKIRHVINDYIPQDDTIFKHPNLDNQIYTAREIYQGTSKIPELEVYDKLVNLNQQTNGNLIATFYVSDLDVKDDTGMIKESRINGFYYKIPNEDLYSNNIYFFKQVPFMYVDSSSGSIVIKTENRWAIFKTDEQVHNHTTCVFVADRSSDLPYIDKKTNTVPKYALRNVKKYPKYIESLDYSYGDFSTDPIIKTNKRYLEPSFYISQFDDPACNGFYYQDNTLHPNRNGKPVYFNDHGKIISYTEPDWILYKDYTNNYNCEPELITDPVTGKKSYARDEYGNIKYVKRLNEHGNPIVDADGNFLYEPLETNKFWILTDDKETVEFKDAYYFACCYINDESIFKKRNTEITKVFHKSTDPEKDNLTWGVSINVIEENEDLIDPVHGYIKPVYDNYSNYTRNHFNAVVLKNKPLSYLYINNKTIRNLYPEARIKVNTDCDRYSFDKEGNPFGALDLHNDNSITISNDPIMNSSNWTISFRAMFNDQDSIDKVFRIGKEFIEPKKWAMITITSIIDYEYYLGIITEVIKRNARNALNEILDIHTDDYTDIELRIIQITGNNIINSMKKNVYDVISCLYIENSADGINCLTSLDDVNRRFNLIQDYTGNYLQRLVDNIAAPTTSTKLRTKKNEICFEIETVLNKKIKIAIASEDGHYTAYVIDDNFQRIRTFNQIDIPEDVTKQQKAFDKFIDDSNIHINRLLKLEKIRSDIADALNDLIDQFQYVEFNTKPSCISKAFYILTGKLAFDTLSRNPNLEYYNLYIDGNLVRNDLVEGRDFFKNDTITKDTITFDDVNLKISEYALWDYPLSEWYINTITNFRILRSRPETHKSRTSKSSSNYRPLFVLDDPREAYPINESVLPESIIGDRFGDGYHADPYTDGKLYKTEVNPLWRNKLRPTENKDHYVKDGALCTFYRKEVVDGKEVVISSNCIVDTNSIPYWWIRKPNAYKTGPVKQNLVYISLKEKVNDVYPEIKFGGIDTKPGNYCDIGLHFDGVDNTDSSYYNDSEIEYHTNKEKSFWDITFDPNSMFTSEYNKYVLTGYNSNNFIGWARNFIVPMVVVDYEVLDIHEEARNFYPFDDSDKIKEIPIRWIYLDNNGATYTEDCTQQESIIVPDIAQLTLPEYYKSNGIFHNELKFYVVDSRYEDLRGIWKPKDHVDSYQDGDFDCCYSRKDAIDTTECVLTYQRESGFFWWELRVKKNDEWITLARTYVAPHWNQSRTMDWHDYVNWNQIDIVGQPICEFKDTDYEDFATKSWGEIEQTVIDERRFTCGSWIKFAIVDAGELSWMSDINKKVYSDGKRIYFYDKVSKKWFATRDDVETEWEIDPDSIDFVAKEIRDHGRTPSGFMYSDGYLYFYIDIDKKWVRINIFNEIASDIKWSKHYQPWDFYKSRNTDYGYMNVIDSTNGYEVIEGTSILTGNLNIDCYDNTYVIPDNVEIIETYAKLIKFNGVNEFDWTKHMNEEFYYQKSVNNDVSLARCSVKDSAHAYVYQLLRDSNNNVIEKVLEKREDYIDIDYDSSKEYVKIPSYKSMNYWEKPLDIRDEDKFHQS